MEMDTSDYDLTINSSKLSSDDEEEDNIMMEKRRRLAIIGLILEVCPETIGFESKSRKGLHTIVIIATN
jgi:hypothetical protein